MRWWMPFKKVNDVNILFNITDILTQCLRYHKIYNYAHTILAYLRDCLTYMRQVAPHTMHYINGGMTNILSSDKLPAEKPRSMLRRSKSQLPSIMHLPMSSDNTLNFYQYLKTHMLVDVLIDVPIQDRAQQLQVYEVFNLPVPHRNVSAQ